MTRDDRRHVLWVSTYPNAPQMYYTKAWTATLTPMEALRELLKTLWDVHAEITKEKCPFIIMRLPKFC